MLAVNGAAFEGLVRAGLTAGQVDDALARLGKRVHRTDVGWESRQVGGLVDFTIACYPGPGGVRTRWTSDVPSSNRRNGSSKRAAASQAARSPTARLPRHQQTRDALPGRRIHRAGGRHGRARFEPTRSASPAPNSSDPPTRRSSSPQPPPATRPHRRHHQREHAPARTTATRTTRPRSKRSGTGCSSSLTPATTFATTCRTDRGRSIRPGSHQLAVGASPNCAKPKQPAWSRRNLLPPNCVSGEAVRRASLRRITGQAAGTTHAPATAPAAHAPPCRAHPPQARTASRHPTIRTTTTHDRDSRSRHRRSHTGPSPRTSSD